MMDELLLSPRGFDLLPRGNAPQGHDIAGAKVLSLGFLRIASRLRLVGLVALLVKNIRRRGYLALPDAAGFARGQRGVRLYHHPLQEDFILLCFVAFDERWLTVLRVFRCCWHRCPPIIAEKRQETHLDWLTVFPHPGIYTRGRTGAATRQPVLLLLRTSGEERVDTAMHEVYDLAATYPSKTAAGT